jgi:hypothetical protein
MASLFGFMGTAGRNYMAQKKKKSGCDHGTREGNKHE